jgi:hypothetical protein
VPIRGPRVIYVDIRRANKLKPASDLHFSKTKANLKCPRRCAGAHKNQHTAGVPFLSLPFSKPIGFGHSTTRSKLHGYSSGPAATAARCIEAAVFTNLAPS